MFINMLMLGKGTPTTVQICENINSGFTFKQYFGLLDVTLVLLHMKVSSDLRWGANGDSL